MDRNKLWLLICLGGVLFLGWFTAAPFSGRAQPVAVQKNAEVAALSAQVADAKLADTIPGTATAVNASGTRATDAASAIVTNIANAPDTNNGAVPAPAAAISKTFYGIPWGMPRTEVAALIKLKKWEPVPKGFYATSNLNYYSSFAGYPARISFIFRGDYKSGYSCFYQGRIQVSATQAPIEQLYARVQAELSKQYGEVPELGYPPLRNTLTEKPWRPGSGKVWEFTTPEGQVFELQSQLNLEKDGFMLLIYRNLSVEREFKNFVNPLPPGDPLQAASDLDGFESIAWGSKPLEVKTAMDRKGFKLSKETGSPLNYDLCLSFNAATWKGYAIESVDCYFKHNRFYFSSVNLRAAAPEEGEALYQKLLATLTAAYGAPKEERDFRGRLIYLWEFPLAGFKPNYIMLHRDKDLLMVGYVNQALEAVLNNL